MSRVLAYVLALLLIVPLGLLVFRAATDWTFGSGAIEALRLSLTSVAVSMSLLAISGIPLAFGLRRLRWARALVAMPAVLPPAVAGIALLLTFGRTGPLGPVLERFGIEVAFTPVALILAQLFVAAPFFLGPLSEALANLDPDLEASARLDGANDGQLRRQVLIPAVRPILIGSLAIATARALGEFGATLLFAGNLPGVTQTAPLAIYLGLEQDLRVAVSLSVALLVIAVPIVLFGHAQRGR